MVGFKNARSIQDEKLIEAIFHSHALHTGPRCSTTASPVSQSQPSTQQVVYGATSTNLIIDARPTTNAMANTVKGAGTENMENYKGCHKAYLGIDNIHVMRDSLNKVVSAIHESFVSGNSVSSEALKRSGWLKHISAVLDGTSLITRTVHVFNSHVLIHCSDGWDRTSQLSALSQVCLSPFYRTFAGFAVLIEKDWLSCGHKFSDRSGIVVPGKEMVTFGNPPSYSNTCAPSSHFASVDGETGGSGSGAWVASFQKQLNFASSSGHSHAYKETSPVFHQFLDCVYQLQRQFPKRFEFNSVYLQRLHKELYAGQYGTFLFDSEAERIRVEASQRTRSVWELFMPGQDLDEYRNPVYDPTLDDATNRTNEDQGVLLPDAKDVIFWWELFGCDNVAMNPPKPADPYTAPEGSLQVSSRRRDREGSPDPTDSSSLSSSLAQAAHLPVSEPIFNPTRGDGPVSLAEALPSYLTAPFTGSPSHASSSSLVNSKTQEAGSGSYSSTSGEPFQVALQTARTMGWSTWDRLKRGYEEATKVPSVAPTTHASRVSTSRVPSTAQSKIHSTQENRLPKDEQKSKAKQLRHGSDETSLYSINDLNPWTVNEAHEGYQSKQRGAIRSKAVHGGGKRAQHNSNIEDPWISDSIQAETEPDPDFKLAAGQHERSSEFGTVHKTSEESSGAPTEGLMRLGTEMQLQTGREVLQGVVSYEPTSTLDPLGVGLT